MKYLIGSSILNIDIVQSDLTDRGHSVEELLPLYRYELLSQYRANMNGGSIHYLSFITDEANDELAFEIATAIHQNLELHLIGPTCAFYQELSKRSMSIHLYSNWQNFMIRNFFV